MPQRSKRALVVDQDQQNRKHLEALLHKNDCEVTGLETVEAAVGEWRTGAYGSVFCDVSVAGDLLSTLGRTDPDLIVIVTADEPQAGLVALDQGAFDCLVTPVEPWHLALALRRATALASARDKPPKERVDASPQRNTDTKTNNRSKKIPMVAGMVAQSRAMGDVFRLIKKVAQSKTSVLITGESGTGKELVAQAIHSMSPRRRKRFVAINCGAIPGNLLESELFGHRRGAFTDAVKDKTGLFESADGGTLFLDEIGELPLNLQVKLLRSIQEEEIRRIGDTAPTKINVRIIAATLRDLSRDVSTGRFREDLYYRLNVVPVRLPALCERVEDIPILVEHFVEKYSKKHNNKVEGVTEEAMALLKSCPWPGNIRELENTIERAMILCDGPTIDVHIFDDKSNHAAQLAEPDDLSGLPEGLSIKKNTRFIEERLIRKALDETGGNRTNAAKLLEISHRALLYKIREYGI